MNALVQLSGCLLLSLSIPDGLQHAKEEVGVVQKKWAQRSELPLSEVR
jgi:hypothetical protein